MRRLQQHLWITDPFHDAGDEDPPDEENQQFPDLAEILNWSAKVQDHHQLDGYSDA